MRIYARRLHSGQNPGAIGQINLEGRMLIVHPSNNRDDHQQRVVVHIGIRIHVNPLRFETLKLQEDIAQIKEISVFSHSPLESDIQTRIKTVAAGKFKGIPLNLAVNSALEGGMVIMVGSTVIDCSSKTRLSSLWGGQ